MTTGPPSVNPILVLLYRRTDTRRVEEIARVQHLIAEEFDKRSREPDLFRIAEKR